MAALRFLFLLWFALYVWSFASLALLEPTGDGFTRGLNRVTAFVGSQLGAGAVAFAIAITGRGVAESVAQRWLVRLPLILAAVFALMVIGIIGYAMIGGTAPTTIPMEGKITVPPTVTR